MKGEKKIQYVGTKPIGNLLLDIKVRIDAKVEEKLYEDCETLKAVSANEYGIWEVEYDREAIETQIQNQIIHHLEQMLDRKRIKVKLDVGGKALIGFPSDMNARSIR